MNVVPDTSSFGSFSFSDRDTSSFGSFSFSDRDTFESVNREWSRTVGCKAYCAQLIAFNNYYTHRGEKSEKSEPVSEYDHNWRL